MNSNLKTLTEILPGISESDLLVSLKEPAMHVFDAIIVRERLERKFGLEIPDAEWNGFRTLAQALEYCEQQQPAGPTTVTSTRVQKIGMPQMANKALSENWLLKEMGDMHWEMLSKGLGQQSSHFTDASGDRLYAAFVRITYSLDPLNTFRENETLCLAGKMTRFEDCAYISDMKGACGDKIVEANMMTSFLARRHNDNAQIVRSMPQLATNHITKLTHAPALYTEHRQVKKGKVEEIESGGHTFTVTDQNFESIVHSINPHFEINGAGLLYFASYPLIADRCATKFFRNTLGIKEYDKEYHTTFRDIFFFANCNADDEILVTLNNIEQPGDNTVKLTMSMFRKSDNKLMARLFTVKQRGN